MRKKKKIAMSVKRAFKRAWTINARVSFAREGAITPDSWCIHLWLRQLTRCLSCPAGKKQKHIPFHETDYAHLISPTKLRQKKSRSRRVSLKQTIARDSRTRESEYVNWRGFFQSEIMLALFSKYHGSRRCIVWKPQALFAIRYNLINVL